MAFAKDFVWGAAAASYQVEGAASADGRGLSVWDMMCRQPGRVWEGNTGAEACDHYHRYAEDVGLMGDLGLHAYRLSLAWPRILPEGTGKVNLKGLDFYDRLIDALLAHRIQPWVTLFHWDYPYPLYLKGGWLNRDSADWFADYARVVVDRLGDRVGYWMTQNEPQCYLGLGLRDGVHAPGDKLGLEELLLANHHSLLGHGKAVQAIRAYAKRPSKIGAAPVGVVAIPATDSAADIAAARQRVGGVTDKGWWNNVLFTDPMILGDYPECVRTTFAAEFPTFPASDLKTICQPLDFYGANIYHGAYIEATPEGGTREVTAPLGRALTMMNWPVTPEALYWGPKLFHERYKLPIVITENGLANTDWLAVDGKVHDPQRIDFTTRYLRELRRAADDGVPVAGYFHWSILDNFEWSLGYSKRFGMIYVDYPTQRRVPKDSYYWYREIIRGNGAALG